MDLTFRLAQQADVAAAQQTYQLIIDHLAATVDFPHWHTENHPTPEEVDGWIAAGELYLALTDQNDIAGVMVLNHDAVAAYQEADWALAAAPHEVLVVHALGVVPAYLGTGVSHRLVDAALEIARQQDCKAVRLDTYVENMPARKLYERHGFRDLGCHTVVYEGTDLNQFHLFEYVL